MLITHNLKAAWRNILKYKVQNTISVLCLSVGVILFGITLYCTNIIWQNDKHIYDANRIKCSIYQNKEFKEFFTYNELGEISKLPSVKSLIYRSCTFYPRVDSIDFQNGKFAVYTRDVHTRTDEEYPDEEIIPFPCSYNLIPTIEVSPEWLADNNFYSAITGKKIGTLKRGMVILDKLLSERLFGKDVNPTGRKIEVLEGEPIINDVVYSTTYMGERGRMYVVADNTERNSQNSIINDYIEYIIKDGCTQEDLKKDLSQLFPDSEIKSHALSERQGWNFMFSISIMIFLGISVLVIGMSGYLKMQLQLFLLRSREMTLRRCNGAKPFELFMLLCTEVFIIFCIVAIISILLSIGISECVMPIIRKYGLSNSMDICPQVIYNTEILVISITFICAIVIAWCIVRKILKSPLYYSVGHGYSQNSLWNGTMQTTQYLVTVILFSIMTWLLFFFNAKTSQRYRVDPEHFKNIADIRATEFHDDVIKLPSVEKVALRGIYKREVKKRLDKVNQTLIPSLKSYNDSTNLYHWAVTDPEYFAIFKKQIVEKQTHNGDRAMDIPVFTCLENVDSIKNILSLRYKTSNELHVLPNGNQYALIGFTSSSDFRYGVGYMERFYIIRDRDKYVNETKFGERYLPLKQYVMPKNNDIEKFKSEYKALWHKNNPKAPNDVEIPILTVYETEFPEVLFTKYLSELICILASICIICIILTVYSSISLETRGKQKEVAIRKVNGAKTGDIVMLFGRYYIVTLGIAFGIALLIYIAAYNITLYKDHDTTEEIMLELAAFLVSMVIISLVTLLTVWQKIYKISHINPALLIKKE